MADKHLHCVECSKYLGVVRDGNLSKGLTPVCSSCMTNLTANKPTSTPEWSDVFGEKDKGDFSDIFKDIFK